jgi:transposase-like protein
MQMLYPLPGSIQQYVEGVGTSQERDRCRPSQCPQCESKQPLVCHGFYARTVEDEAEGFVIRVRRYFCAACRRTVSLLPEFVLPYLRFTIRTIGLFLKARLLEQQTLKAAAEAAHQPTMPYQRGQQWVDRFCRHAEGLSLSLAALISAGEAADFVAKAMTMLERTGWIEAHRFLLTTVRVHLLGWPPFLAPNGFAVTINGGTGA